MKTRVAIIGCGTITEVRHAPEYSANLNAEIVAFCDPVIGRAERLAMQYGGQALTRYEDVLALKNVDAISVCSSNSTHAEITIEALRSGLHVLCEKPMASSLDDARNMIMVSERYGKTLMIDMNQRLAPAHIKAKQILQQGMLGRVLSFKTTFGHGGPEGWSKDKGSGTWFFRKNLAAIGALGDLGVHKADLIRWLSDDEIDEVCAYTATLDKTYDDGSPIDVEDNAICVLKLRSGAVGTLCTSWTNYGEEENSTILYCEKGVLRIYSLKDHPLVMEQRSGDKKYIEAGAIQTNACQSNTGIIDAFVCAVQSGSRPPITGEDGFEALSIILACESSSSLGKPVRVSHYSETEN